MRLYLGVLGSLEISKNFGTAKPNNLNRATLISGDKMSYHLLGEIHPSAADITFLAREIESVAIWQLGSYAGRDAKPCRPTNLVWRNV